MQSLIHDVDEYEKWLSQQCDVVQKELEKKHARMAADPFMFLRATYFRWARIVPFVCPKLMEAPSVTCVGDIHVENYGTWRDADGRQVWGVNDFDEAAVMPYTMDLLRLTCSAGLVPGIELRVEEVTATVLEGYLQGLNKPGPILVSEHSGWYRKLATSLVDSSRGFWKRFNSAPNADPKEHIQQVLKDSMPQGAKPKRFTAVSRGGGSLGRPRFQLLGKWQGGAVLREAKSIVPSAWYWAANEKGLIHIQELAYGAHRSPDPSLALRGQYLCRRLSPSARKLDLADVGGANVIQALLGDMGRELGSIHRAHPTGVHIRKDLDKRKKTWLTAATESMLQPVRDDFSAWCGVQRQRGE